MSAMNRVIPGWQLNVSCCIVFVDCTSREVATIYVHCLYIINYSKLLSSAIQRQNDDAKVMNNSLYVLFLTSPGKCDFFESLLETILHQHFRFQIF